MHRFFTNGINEYEKTISITGEDVNHIKNVLRLSEGDEITISDGRGRDYISCISSINENEVLADIVDICDTAAELIRIHCLGVELSTQLHLHTSRVVILKGSKATLHRRKHLWLITMDFN